MLIEEMAELTQALLKYRRKPQSQDIEFNVHEEVADVEIVLGQIKLLLRHGLVEKFKEQKLERLQTLINKQ